MSLHIVIQLAREPYLPSVVVVFEAVDADDALRQYDDRDRRRTSNEYAAPLAQALEIGMEYEV